MADPNFLSRMKNMDVYNIPKNVQSKIKIKIASNPSFVPNEIKSINLAAKSLCEWIRAVAGFTDIWKEISQKKAFVKEMNEELDKANATLQEKQAELQKVIDKVNILEKEYNDNKLEKEKLDEEISRTQGRLGRASQLTGEII